jgi:glycosyltransferase involved in cell wall biosynthesis
MQKIHKNFKNYKLLFIGKGGLESQLKEEAESLGIMDNVKFLGFRDDVKEIYKILDIFVLPSLSEGLPLSLLEAVASKVPVIASKVGGIPEIIKDGINGFLIPPKNVPLLSEKIYYLLQNQEIAKQLAQEAYHNYLKNFEISIMVNKYENLFSGIMMKSSR